ncbi:class I SAM-dependent methyltransferase [Demetria terragena]|uniref:class I SAM-dependent methyltransferase n=1 Tax=Demetria terragena TaxID=63959 RepID=UPI00039E4B9B|nr:class I SAM-dependent methyltransferase [Demetria terragena]
MVNRLTSGEGRGLLQSLPPYDERTAMALGERLRADGFAPELVAAALTQARLRQAAVAKFGADAARMLLTQDGLEQATRWEVADHHARRFAAAGVSAVHDLGCGIGADAMAFARAGLGVQAVDADEGVALVAEANLRRWPRATADFRRAEDVRLPSGKDALTVGVWFDPARRTPGVADISGRTRRVFRLDQMSPDWDHVREVAARLPVVGAKLSPSFPHAAVPHTAEAAWTSYAGDVVECALWWGPLARTSGRSAHVLGPRTDALVTEDMAMGAPTEFATMPSQGMYLYEPDRAVIRAGLTGALTNATEGRELASGVGYVASRQDVRLPWAKRYLITAAMPFNTKRLRAVLRDRGVGTLTIKKRGVSIDPQALRRQLRLSGDLEATVVLTRVGSVQVALLVRQL